MPLGIGVFIVAGGLFGLFCWYAVVAPEPPPDHWIHWFRWPLRVIMFVVVAAILAGPYICYQGMRQWLRIRAIERAVVAGNDKGGPAIKAAELHCQTSKDAPMANLQWLDGYSGQTVEQLIALEGHYRTDSLVLAFEQAMDQKAARVGDAQLTAEETVILAVEALEREVNNGGYGQFFVNLSREYAPIIVYALRRISCPRTADITEKALKIVQHMPMSQDEIDNGTWEENEERSDLLAECDSMYFARPENIEDSLFAFIKANRAKIET